MRVDFKVSDQDVRLTVDDRGIIPLQQYLEDCDVNDFQLPGNRLLSNRNGKWVNEVRLTDVLDVLPNPTPGERSAWGKAKKAYVFASVAFGVCLRLPTKLKVTIAITEVEA